MTNLNLIPSKIKLKVNMLNTSIKRKRRSKWLDKQDTTFYCQQETQLNIKKLLIKGWKDVYHAKINQKKVGVAMLMLEKVIRAWWW